MATRDKRSISLPAELAAGVDRAAAAAGLTVSAWLAQTAAHRLKVEAGLAGVAGWEAEVGALSPEERADGEEWARRILAADSRSARVSA